MMLESAIGDASGAGVEYSPEMLEGRVPPPVAVCHVAAATVERRPSHCPLPGGWFGSTESADGGQSLEALWVWQLIQKRPEFADVLALSQGCAVVFEGPEIELVLGPDGRRLAGRNPMA